LSGTMHFCTAQTTIWQLSYDMHLSVFIFMIPDCLLVLESCLASHMMACLLASMPCDSPPAARCPEPALLGATTCSGSASGPAVI
jgi:hypothetical protein